VFTVVVCLMVVALSGAAVLRITLSSDTQGATAQAEPGIKTSDATGVPAPAPLPDPAPAAPVVADVEPVVAEPVVAEPVDDDDLLSASAEGQLAPTATVQPHRIRSAGLLVVLLTALGVGLALVVAVVLVLSMLALRAALG
jgi:hypothetical protein